MSNTEITASIISKAFLCRLNDEWTRMKQAVAKEAASPLLTPPRGIATYRYQHDPVDLSLSIVDYETRYLVPAAQEISKQLVEAGVVKTCLLEVPSVEFASQNVWKGHAARVLKVYDAETDREEIRIDVGYA